MGLFKRIDEMIIDEQRRKKIGRPQTEEEKKKLKIARKHLKSSQSS